VKGIRQRAGLVRVVLLAAAVFASPAPAAERELDQEPPPSSASEIETPIQRVFPVLPERPRLFPWIRQRLKKLPPFFADTRLEARFRTYYLHKDRTGSLLGDDGLSEAWAMGGSIYYRSGWLEDLFQLEVEGFTSQPIYAPRDSDDTLLLAPGQEGYSVLGIANGKLRYKGIVLTGFRQYLDLPYFNRRDNRMTPNTFESITLQKPEGTFKFSTGYTWNIKPRNSDEFVSLTERIDIEEDRGLAHAGAAWDPHEDFHIGAIGGVIPDVFVGLYAELGWGRDIADGWELRLDGQFTYDWDIGADLSEELIDETWNLGIRASTSYAGAVFRLGLSINARDASVFSPYGTNPSYVDLMQRSFTTADEKALLVSLSYDFSRLELHGLSLIVNFVAGFDSRLDGDAQEVDITFDYRVKEGWLKSFWLRIRGSWLSEESADRDGTDVRVILRYDFPVI
jgi:hypothetical protein